MREIKHENLFLLQTLVLKLVEYLIVVAIRRRREEKGRVVIEIQEEAS